MANDVRTGPEPSVTGLLSEILDDVQDLTKQQLALFKEELRTDLRKTREVALTWVLGMAGILFGAGLLGLMLVHILHEQFQFSLWVSYGSVAVVAALGGGVLLLLGKRELDAFNPLPDQSVQALKENVRCLMNRK